MSAPNSAAAVCAATVPATRSAAGPSPHTAAITRLREAAIRANREPRRRSVQASPQRQRSSSQSAKHRATPYSRVVEAASTTARAMPVRWSMRV